MRPFLFLMQNLIQNINSQGIRFALLNVILAIFCGISFVGVLALTTTLGRPFPYLILLALYALLFLGLWLFFGNRLSGNSTQNRTTAALAASPLFLLGFLSYLSAISVMVLELFIPDIAAAASPFLAIFLGTLLIIGGFGCMLIILLPTKSLT